MFGMDLFKLAGIDLPKNEPGFVWHVLIMREGSQAEESFADIKDALAWLLEGFKQHKDVTHVSISKRVE